jgi:hypothetical protein
MTSHAEPHRGAISYEEWLHRRVTDPGVCCGPPVYSAPSFWQDLFPWLKDAGLRELERQAREAERRPRELEIG